VAGPDFWEKFGDFSPQKNTLIGMLDLSWTVASAPLGKVGLTIAWIHFDYESWILNHLQIRSKFQYLGIC
jgi:hypothetical protein